MKYVYYLLLTVCTITANNIEELKVAIQKNKIGNVERTLELLHDHIYTDQERNEISQKSDQNIQFGIQNRYNKGTVINDLMFGLTSIGCAIGNEVLIATNDDDSSSNFLKSMHIIDGTIFAHGLSKLRDVLFNCTNENRYQTSLAIKGLLHKKGILPYHEPEEAS